MEKIKIEYQLVHDNEVLMTGPDAKSLLKEAEEVNKQNGYVLSYTESTQYKPWPKNAHVRKVFYAIENGVTKYLSGPISSEIVNPV